MSPFETRKGGAAVQRYEGEMGLPVRRPAGKSRGSVVATKSELDAWVIASPIRETFHLTTAMPELQVREVAAVKFRIKEMRVLREQMLALHQELMESVRLLRESIESIEGELKPNNWQAAPPIMGQSPQSRRLLDWLSTEIRRRRAS